MGPEGRDQREGTNGKGPLRYCLAQSEIAQQTRDDLCLLAEPQERCDARLRYVSFAVESFHHLRNLVGEIVGGHTDGGIVVILTMISTAFHVADTLLF